MKFHDKVGGVMKLCHFLDFKHRKQLVDVTQVSQLSYGIELFSQGTEKQMTRLQGMLSHAAQLLHQTGMLGWSKTQGLKELGWLTFIQTAAETSVKTMLKVLINKSSQNLHTALTNKDGSVKTYSEEELRKMTQIRRKSWSVGSLYWYRLVPAELKVMKPGTDAWKQRVKKWVKRTVKDKKGDMYSEEQQVMYMRL